MKKGNLNLLLIFTPLVIFCIYFFSVWENVLREDDYWVINDLIRFKEGKTFLEKMEPLLLVRNSHRYITATLLGFIQFVLFGQVFAKTYFFVGFLAFLTTGYIFLRVIKAYNKNVNAAVFFLLFTPVSYSLSFWALPSITFFVTGFFAVLITFLLSGSGKRFFAYAVALGVIMTLSNGNGMMIWPAGLLVLLLSKRYKESAWWVIFFIGSVLLYFTAYKNEGVTDFSVVSPLAYVMKVAICLVTFPGNGVDFFPDQLVSRFATSSTTEKLLFLVRLGFIASVGLAFIFALTKSVFDFFFKKGNEMPEPKRRATLFMIGIGGFIFLTALTVSLLRAHFGFGMGLSARYKYYGQIVLVILYLYHQLSGKPAFLNRKVVLAISVVYWMACYWVYLPLAKNYKTDSLASILNINVGQNPYIYVSYGEGIDSFITHTAVPELKRTKIFDFNFSKVTAIESNVQEQLKAGSVTPGSPQITRDSTRLTIRSLDLKRMNFRVSYYLLLVAENGQKMYLPAGFQSETFKDPYLEVPLYPSVIPDGQYKVFIMELSGSKPGLITTPYTFKRQGTETTLATGNG